MDAFNVGENTLVTIKTERDPEYIVEEEYYGYGAVEVKRHAEEPVAFAPSSPSQLMDLSSGSERPHYDVASAGTNGNFTSAYLVLDQLGHCMDDQRQRSVSLFNKYIFLIIGCRE